MKTFHPNPLLLLAIALVVTFAGCKKDTSTGSSALYVPTTSDVTTSATLADLQQGRTLYISTCGQCHDLYLPESFTAAQWRSILPNMTPRTSLSSAQIALVTKYVCKGK